MSLGGVNFALRPIYYPYLFEILFRIYFMFLAVFCDRWINNNMLGGDLYTNFGSGIFRSLISC